MTARRLERDLAPLIGGEMSVDPVMRALYSTAACIYRVPPLGVVFPRGAADVAAVLRYAAEEGIPITPRGAGSGVAGQSLGPGLVLDFTRHMNRILEVDPEGGWVRVEPGVVYGALNRRLRRHGLFFPPDPSSGDFCTIGGMLANNSGGAHSVLYGTTDDHVLSATMVLPGGEAYTARRLSPGEVPGDRLAGAVADLLGACAGVLVERRPRTTKNASGYNVWEVLDGEVVDMARLVVGSEGTLGVFTEARLRLSPLPGARATAMACFGGLEEMAEGARELRALGPAAIELMEKSLIDLLSGSDGSELLRGFPPAMEAILLVEVAGRDRDEAEERARACLDGVRGAGGAIDSRLAVDETGQEKLWEIRNRASSIFRLIHHPEKPLRFIEDGAVDIGRLPEYIRRLRGVLSAHGLRAMIFGHAGDGNVHVNPFVDVTEAGFRERIRDVAREVAAIVIDLRGTLTGEHGDGRLRTPFLPDLYGHDVCRLFGEIKALFDPEGILNPGIIAGRVAAAMTDDLRYGRATAAPKPPFDREDVRLEIDKCHGCGNCRVYCPPFGGSGREESTARAKANLLREYRIGEFITEETMTTPLFREVMDLCVNCRLCLTDCPTRVDIPGLAVRARGEIHRRAGFSRADRFLMASGGLSAAAGRFPAISSRVIASGPLRWAMERAVGIDRRRALPPFEGSAEGRDPDGCGEAVEEVVYFPGCFGRHHSRSGERAGTIALLGRLGCRVRVFEGPCCGVARLTIGDLDGFRRRAREWIEAAESVAGPDVPIVFSAPSCLMCVREEYSRHLGEDALRVAARAVDLLQFAGERLDRVRVRRAGGERVLLQIPCHVRSNGTEDAFLRVMAAAGGVEVTGVLRGCCGLSGTFGMRRERFDASMSIGAPLFDAVNAGGTLPVITPCGSCRMQIEQGTGARTEHPAERLARALGDPDGRGRGPDADMDRACI